MKKVLFLFIIIVAFLQAHGQDALNNEFQTIPTISPKGKEKKPSKEENPKKNPPTIVEYPIFVQVDPEVLFKDRTLYKKAANTEGVFYNKNQFLGIIRTKSVTSSISYRDAAFVDGDKVTVYLNDKVIVPEVILDEEFQGFKIDLVPGVNKIDFEALNEGSAAPNTSEFQISDDKGTIISANQWNVGTGYKATIIIVKE